MWSLVASRAVSVVGMNWLPKKPARAGVAQAKLFHFSLQCLSPKVRIIFAPKSLTIFESRGSSPRFELANPFRRDYIQMAMCHEMEKLYHLHLLCEADY